MKVDGPMAGEPRQTRSISERPMLSRSIAAFVLVVLSAGLAQAQITPIASGLPEGANNYGLNLYGYERPITAQDIRELEIEHKYKETLKKIPNKKQSNDPWAGVRPAAVADRHRPM